MKYRTLVDFPFLYTVLPVGTELVSDDGLIYHDKDTLRLFGANVVENNPHLFEPIVDRLPSEQ